MSEKFVSKAMDENAWCLNRYGCRQNGKPTTPRQATANILRVSYNMPFSTV